MWLPYKKHEKEIHLGPIALLLQPSEIIITDKKKEKILRIVKKVRATGYLKKQSDYLVAKKFNETLEVFRVSKEKPFLSSVLVCDDLLYEGALKGEDPFLICQSGANTALYYNGRDGLKKAFDIPPGLLKSFGCFSSKDQKFFILQHQGKLEAWLLDRHKVSLPLREIRIKDTGPVFRLKDKECTPEELEKTLQQLLLGKRTASSDYKKL